MNCKSHLQIRSLQITQQEWLERAQLANQSNARGRIQTRMDIYLQELPQMSKSSLHCHLLYNQIPPYYHKFYSNGEEKQEVVYLGSPLHASKYQYHQLLKLIGHEVSSSVYQHYYSTFKIKLCSVELSIILLCLEIAYSYPVILI